MSSKQIEYMKEQLDSYFKIHFKSYKIKSRLNIIYINIDKANDLVVCMKINTTNNKIEICTKYKAWLFSDNYTLENIYKSDVEFNVANISVDSIVECYKKYKEGKFWQVFNNFTRGIYHG